MSNLENTLKSMIDRLNAQDEKISFLSRLEFASSVSGGLTAGSVVFAGTGGVLSQDNANFFWDDTNNRLGIGTATPSAHIHVLGVNVGGADGIVGLKLDRQYATVGDYMALDFGDTSSNGIARISSIAWGGGEGALTFAAQTASGSGFTNEVMRIRGDGNVGIGTTTPYTLTEFQRLGTTAVRTGAIGAEITVTNSGSSGVRPAGIRFRSSDTGVTTRSSGRILSAFLAGFFPDSALIFQTVSGAETFQDVMTMRGTNVGIGTDSPKAILDVTNGYMRALDNGSNNAPTTGKGVEIVGTGSIGYVQSYNRDTSAWQLLEVDGSLVRLNSGNGNNVSIGSTSNSARLDVSKSDNNADASIGQFFAQNRSQGIGIGYNRLEQVGSNTNGDIYIMSKGTGIVGFYTNGVIRASVDGSGHFLPSGSGTQNLGNATLYWNDISYKTLTDRGCLAVTDTWETLDGRKVSNLQALKELKPHPTEKTIYGEVKLDYKSVPKHSFKEAPLAEDDIDIVLPDGKIKKISKGDKSGEDGVEMTSMFSMMIGAIKELSDKVDALESRSKNK